MGSPNEPDDRLDEAKEYVADLPDETATGRLVGDSGSPADEEKWQAEHQHQEDELGSGESD